MTRLAIALAVAATSLAQAAEPARTFHVTQTLEVAGAATVWLPLPSDDPWQTIRDLRVTVEPAASWERVHDARWGNAAARAHTSGAATVTLRYEVKRRERAADPSGATALPAPSGYAAWLGADARVPLDARVRKIAADVTAGKTTPLERARAIYDYVLSTMRYDKPTGAGQGWGQGDIAWACDKKYGNCTDFHALFIGLLRASGIPARFAIGYAIPTATPGGEIAGYHCWADFYLDGVGWVPVDASEAWKHPDKRDYYFGHHDPNRVQLSTGRDVPLPGARGAALNYFVYPYAEDAGGAPVAVTRAISYAP